MIISLIYKVLDKPLCFYFHLAKSGLLYLNVLKSKTGSGIRVHGLYSVDSTLCRKFETNIPRNETAQPRSQFLRSCICERFIYIPTIGPPYFAVLRLLTDGGNI
jgi:hypothetical protein